MGAFTFFYFGASFRWKAKVTDKKVSVIHFAGKCQSFYLQESTLPLSSRMGCHLGKQGVAWAFYPHERQKKRILIG